jgi:hypothetical protein
MVRNERTKTKRKERSGSVRGKMAKAFRTAVYGDMALRQVRQYQRFVNSGQIINKPGTLRAEYQALKRKAVA